LSVVPGRLPGINSPENSIFPMTSNDSEGVTVPIPTCANKTGLPIRSKKSTQVENNLGALSEVVVFIIKCLIVRITQGMKKCRKIWHRGFYVPKFSCNGIKNGLGCKARVSVLSKIELKWDRKQKPPTHKASEGLSLKSIIINSYFLIIFLVIAPASVSILTK